MWDGPNEMSGKLIMPKAMYQPKYLVFVDFDGVLCSNRVQFTHPSDAYSMWSTFDPVVMEFFNKIHNTYQDVRFVWTTTWRNHVPSNNHHVNHIIYSMWYNAGFRGHFGDPWKVNPDDEQHGGLNHGSRAEEIKHYLDNYGKGIEDYIIIDDSDYGFDKVLGKKRFVKTSSEDGMLFKHMLKAWSLMGTWDRK